jgi:hypothetical protein
MVELVTRLAVHPVRESRFAAAVRVALVWHQIRKGSCVVSGEPARVRHSLPTYLEWGAAISESGVCAAMVGLSARARKVVRISWSSWLTYYTLRM